PQRSPLQAGATGDFQLTPARKKGASHAASGARTVNGSITPRDPSTLGPPPAGLSFLGNAYRLRARYEPSGTEVTTLASSNQIIIVYPVLPNQLSTNHTILNSPDGK